MVEKLRTTLKNKNRELILKTPLIGASGTYGYADEFETFFDFKYLGAIATKGITLEERQGNEGDRLFEVEGGLINRIGLENVGIDAFIKNKLPVLIEKNIDFLLNIAGSTPDDYEKLSAIASDNNIKALEVNVSCPNVKQGCLEFGLNPDGLYNLVSKIRRNYQGFLIVKLSPNTSDIKALAIASQDAGADCISAINTLRGLGVNVQYNNNKFNVKQVQGGLSGCCVKPCALYMIKQIKEAVKIPLIAMGGISKLSDLFEFIAVGADAFEIGTANFSNPKICAQLAQELQDFIEKNGFRDFDDLKGALYNDRN